MSQVAMYSSSGTYTQGGGTHIGSPQSPQSINRRSPSLPVNVPLSIETSIEYEIDKKLFPGLEMGKGKQQSALIIEPSYIYKMHQQAQQKQQAQQQQQQQQQHLKMMSTRRISTRSNRVLRHSPAKNTALHASPIKSSVSPRHSRRLAARRYVPSDIIQKMYNSGDKNIYNPEDAETHTSGDRLDRIDRSPLGGSVMQAVKHGVIVTRSTSQQLAQQRADVHSQHHPQANMTRITDDMMRCAEITPGHMPVELPNEPQTMITRSHQRTLSHISQAYSEPGVKHKMINNNESNSYNKTQHHHMVESMNVEQTLPAAPPGCKCYKCHNNTEHTQDTEQQLRDTFLQKQHLLQMQQEQEQQHVLNQLEKQRIQHEKHLQKQHQSHQMMLRKQQKALLVEKQRQQYQFTQQRPLAGNVQLDTVAQDQCTFAVPLPVSNNLHPHFRHLISCNCSSCLQKSGSLAFHQFDDMSRTPINSLTAFLGAGTPPCDCQSCRVSRENLDLKYSNVMVPNFRYNMAVSRSPQVATPAFIAGNYPYRPMVPSGGEQENQNSSLSRPHTWTSLTPPRDSHHPIASHADVAMTIVPGNTRLFHRNLYRDLVDASSQLNITV